MNFKTAKMVLVLLVLVIAINSTFAAVKTFRVRETDLVTLNPKALDQDHDEVVYTYSPPLDEKGQWQTGYNDAGEYVLEITASDAVNQVTKEVLLIVENKNQPPYLVEKKVRVKELQTVDVKQFVVDIDNDTLEYSFSKPFDSSGVWKPGYNDHGSFVISFTVSDGEFTVPLRLEVEVINTNQPPLVKEKFSDAKIVQVKENEKFSFHAEAEDGDGDKVTYLWTLNGTVVGDAERGEYFFDFDSSGEYVLALVVTDGQKGVQKEWKVQVKDVNRKPELDLLPVTVEEGETVKLLLPEKDEDGDSITYSFEEKFNERGEWQTTYDDAGKHSINVYVSDGKETAKEKVKVTVLNVDRKPELRLPPRLEVWEGGELSFVVDAFDPDGEKVEVSFENAPEDALFDQKTKTLSWTPGYDFISRRQGLLSNILNALRLEHKLLQARTVNLKMNVCSGEFCTSASVPLYVYNYNRAPVLEIPHNVTVTETELLQLTYTAVDPDGDMVRLSFSEPLDDEGRWETSYEDAGEHTVYVNAHDGSASQTLPVKVKVLQKNRQPTMKLSRDNIIVNEGEEFSLSVKTFDPDGDSLSLSVENLPEGASFVNNTFTWKPGYDVVHNVMKSDSLLSEVSFLSKKWSNAENDCWISFVVSDGEFEVHHPIKLVVKDANHKPEIAGAVPAESLTVRRNQPVVFQATAVDHDGDALDYVWDFGVGEEKVTNTSAVERTFVNPGEKKVLVTVSDGVSEVEKEWKVTVLEKEVETTAVALEPAEVHKFKVYVVEY